MYENIFFNPGIRWVLDPIGEVNIYYEYISNITLDIYVYLSKTYYSQIILEGYTFTGEIVNLECVSGYTMPDTAIKFPII